VLLPFDLIDPPTSRTPSQFLLPLMIRFPVTIKIPFPSAGRVKSAPGLLFTLITGQFAISPAVGQAGETYSAGKYVAGHDAAQSIATSSLAVPAAPAVPSKAGVLSGLPSIGPVAPV
jgi:hypothetical protein